MSDKLTLNLINAGGRSLINTAITGGSLEDGITDASIEALVDTARREMTGQFKVLRSEYMAHKLAHALPGCAPGAATLVEGCVGNIAQLRARGTRCPDCQLPKCGGGSSTPIKRRSARSSECELAGTGLSCAQLRLMDRARAHQVQLARGKALVHAPAAEKQLGPKRACDACVLFTIQLLQFERHHFNLPKSNSVGSVLQMVNGPKNDT
ncbi:DUF637 domain-containing protein [Comamonadaceae bacterium PP-2]